MVCMCEMYECVLCVYVYLFNWGFYFVLFDSVVVFFFIEFLGI